MSGVILVNKNIKLQRDLEDSGESTRNYPLGQSKEMKFLNQIADMLKMKEKKGVSFGLVCGAIVVLFIVIFLNVLEFFLAQNKAMNEYGILI